MSGVSLARPLPPPHTGNRTTDQAVSSPFGIDSQSQPALAPHQNEPPSLQPAGRSAAGITKASDPVVTSARMPMPVGPQAAMGRTLAMGAPSGPPEPSGAHTPLRHSQFESELAQHPNKAWVSRLLSGITHGVDIGYMGPREPMDARNLLSAHTHPHIHAHLQKEVEAGRIRGPFQDRPFPSLRCSGLGVVPKKGNKWRMILHLSAPFGSSIKHGQGRSQVGLPHGSCPPKGLGAPWHAVARHLLL